ncbi:hypothetical protein CF326_g6414 [Tilletia indica]|nr:hypothetical protein CF326_g6414 [Tilletia indica]
MWYVVGQPSSTLLDIIDLSSLLLILPVRQENLQLIQVRQCQKFTIHRLIIISLPILLLLLIVHLIFLLSLYFSCCSFSHPVPALVTKENYEVSAYGDLKTGDFNDHWVAEVVDDLNLGKARPNQALRSLSSRIRFRHKNQQGCYLFASTALLPQWGWKQVEVSCIRENNPKDDHTHWIIESHTNAIGPGQRAKNVARPPSAISST